MGMLQQGKWTDNEVVQVANDGEFVRVASKFRDTIGAGPESRFAPEPGRYHLFTAPSCPWAHRTVIVRRIKGLEGVISNTAADLPRIQGWTFSQGLDEMQPQNGQFPLHRVYCEALPDYTGRVTVPVMWDRKTRTIVNNESSEIIRFLNSAFRGIADDSIDLYPEALRAQIDEVNGFVYEHVNNGVYRTGFAKTQQAYEAACRKVFAGLEEIETRLSKQRFLAGDRLTEADVRLFPTLVRFDSIYYSHFKCNLKRIEDFPNLSNYLRDLYQRKGFGDTVDIAAFKHGYYTGQLQVNPTGIVPLGPNIDFSRPHDRARFG